MSSYQSQATANVKSRPNPTTYIQLNMLATDKKTRYENICVKLTAFTVECKILGLSQCVWIKCSNTIKHGPQDANGAAN